MSTTPWTEATWLGPAVAIAGFVAGQAGQAISATGLRTADCGEIQFRKAGLLDVPFLFGLMLDGSLAGAFSDSYLRDAGHFKLFTLVLGTVFVRPLWMTRHPARGQTLLVCSKGLEVGFIQLDNTAGTSECPVSTIALFAIAKRTSKPGAGDASPFNLDRNTASPCHFGGLLHKICARHAACSLKAALHAKQGEGPQSREIFIPKGLSSRATRKLRQA